MPVGAAGGVPVVAPWVTKIFQPATEMMPERDQVPVFAANVGRSVPLPLPEAPAPNVIHGTFAVAVQAQPVGAVIVMSREPVVRLKLVGETM